MKKSFFDSFQSISLLIIIQGPYVESTGQLAFQLSKIFANARIIISCYDETLDESVENSFEIRRTKDPKSIKIPPSGKMLNIKRQVATTLNASWDAREYWTLKIRSDLIIENVDAFISQLIRFKKSLDDGLPLNLFTLSTGSFDIFSYYKMPFHFNDWFFICKTKTLVLNCKALMNLDERSLIYKENDRLPPNYRHAHRYRLRFHNEQLMHFGHRLLNQTLMNHCCDTSHFVFKRQIVFVGKHLLTTTCKQCGIRSAKVGIPSISSHLVGISDLTISLHSHLLKEKNSTRVLLFVLLKVIGGLKSISFLTLKVAKLMFYNSIRVFKFIAARKTT